MKKKLITTLCITAASIGAMTIGGYKAIEYACKRQYNNRTLKEMPDDYMEWYSQIVFEDMYIESYDGSVLKAKFLRNNTNKLLIAVHGYHSNNLFEYAYFLKFYHEMGYSILLPDNRAHGESEGKWIGFGWLDRLDIMKWIDTMIDMNHDYSIVLHGISMGSSTVLNVSGEDIADNVKCIISDCGFTNVYDQMIHVGKKSQRAMLLLLPIANLMSKKILGYNFKEASPLLQVQKSKIPTLFIHGEKDTYVPLYMVYDLYEACGAKKELLVVEGAKHANSYFVNKDLYEKRVKSFIEKYGG